MTNLNSLASVNAARWAKARAIRDVSPIAKRLVSSKLRYQAVAARTGVPWAVIAVIHEREASQDWHSQLGQGDPLDRVSTHVPKGRGPFGTWEDGAVDALVNCAPYAARNKDWSVGGTLAKLEEYNGLGYAARGMPSPYIWSGTDQYRSGKFVRDGVFNPDAVDRQAGCAALLKAMMSIDPTITFACAPVASPKSSRPSIANPAKGSLGAFLVSLLAIIVKRK